MADKAQLILDDFKRELKFHFSEYLGVLLTTPHWVYISLTHECNNDCIMCCVKDILPGKVLPSAKIKEMLKEISKWESDPTIVFTGGETFLRSDIFELIRYATEKGIEVEAVTNGSMVTPALAEKIVTSGLSNIAVSLDGGNASTHDFVRGREGSFEEVKKALLNLAAAKKKFGTEIQISAWVTIMAQNVSELQTIYDLAKEIGVECLVYHPVIKVQEDMQNTDTASDVWIGDDLVAELGKQVEWLKSKKDDKMVPMLHEPELFLSYFDSSITKNEWKCNPYEFINVGPDGMVSSCGEGFGNVFDMTLADALSSKSASRARAKMKACEKPCLQTCWARLSADDLSEITKEFLDAADSLSGWERENCLKQGFKILNDFENMM